ncbi:glucan synthase 1-related protein [Minicystis rosea]|nr:glucan synthase 1-related protein [Minicystis rosea]
MASVEQAFQRIERWLLANAPGLHAELRPPATPEQIAAAEAKLGVRFPDDVRALYRLHDGQGRDGSGLLGGWTWLDLAHVVSEWQIWKDLLDKGTFGANDGGDPGPGVRGNWWNPRWIPLTYSGSGDHHCIDLAPADGGAEGQIIRMWHDMEGRSLVAASLSTWLERTADELESGERVYDEEYGALLRPDEI